MMSFTPAKIITSKQEGVHKNLETILQKYLRHKYQKPIAAHNKDMFTHAHQWWQKQGQKPTILDSGCGTGQSSRFLAEQYPQHLVIGLDQSAKRLQHSDNQQLPNNCLLLRCECTDFWRLAEQQGWQFARHTIFYPNPYPKPQHLQRRWHGNPTFLTLLNISHSIELRTNWKIYAQEFYHALQFIRDHSTQQDLLLFKQDKHILLEDYHPTNTITAFERKYILSKHFLYKVLANNQQLS